MCLIASGKAVKQIAEELSLSISTISTHRARLLLKMNLKPNADITRYALHHRLVEEAVRLGRRRDVGCGGRRLARTDRIEVAQKDVAEAEGRRSADPEDRVERRRSEVRTSSTPSSASSGPTGPSAISVPSPSCRATHPVDPSE